MSRAIAYLFIVGCLFCVQAQAVPDGLVGYWSFDEGNGDIAFDGSGNANDGVITGSPTWVEGQIGTALDFGGTSALVSAPHIPLDNRSFTIAMWVNLAANNTGHEAFGQQQAGEKDKHLHIRLGGTGDPAPGGIKMGFYCNDASTGGGILDLGLWYHLGFVYDIDAQQQRIYVNGELVLERPSTPYMGTAGDTRIGKWRFNGIIDDVQLYQNALTESEIQNIMGGLINPNLASAPSPKAKLDDVNRDSVLSWTPGENTGKRNLYMGASIEEVASMTTPTAANLTVNSFDPGRLEFGKTYFWRVDEVNVTSDKTVFMGDIWSFTVEPFAYPVEDIIVTTNGVSDETAGPENTINGSGLNVADEHSTVATDMWLASPGAEPLYIQYEFDSVIKLHEMLIWNYNVPFEATLGFGAKDVTVDYSENGIDWLVLGDDELAQASSQSDYTANSVIAFDGVAAKFVRLNVNSSYGSMGPIGLSEVRFLSIPAQAREPQPANGDIDVAIDAALNWRAGRDAVSHEVYCGTDPEALTLVDATPGTSYVPGTLDLATMYYWKVDEVNETNEISVWPGRLWSFTTEEFIVVDDFESYDDDENRIYETWIDGYEAPDNGSTVGYLESPFAETSIVNGGGHAMPLFYDNAGIATSEANLDLSQDWTASGIKTLSLHFHGDPDNTGQLYLKINNTKVVYDGDAADIAVEAWQTWNIDLSTVGNVSNVTSLTIGIEGAGATGVVYIDDIRLYHLVPE